MVEDFISAGADFGLNPNALIFSYGMAEASLVVCSHRFQNMEHSFDATGGLWHANNGKSLDGIEVDLNGQSWGTYKEIRVRGKSLFEMPAASDQQTDGWYHTGDVGYLKNRDLYVVGRARDYVIVDGCNVHAADIEQVLCDAIGLAETVIQPVNGRLCVWLVTKRTDWSDFAEVKKILKKCFTVTNPFVDTIRPGHVVRNASGKIVKDLTVKRLMRKSCVMLAEL